MEKTAAPEAKTPAPEAPVVRLPSPGTPQEALLGLQRSAGNRAVGRYLRDGARGRRSTLSRASGRRRLDRKLKLTGTTAHINRVLAVINQGVSPEFTAAANAAGEVELTRTGQFGPPTTANGVFIARLTPIINEAATTTVDVVAGGEPIVGSYGLSRIDIADIEALGFGQRGWDARGALLHELVEQREKQQGTTAAQRAFGSPTTGAHGVALAAELDLIGATLESDTNLVGATQNADGTINGHRTVVFRYPDGKRFSVKVTLSHNNITAVTRTPLP